MKIDDVLAEATRLVEPSAEEVRRVTDAAEAVLKKAEAEAVGNRYRPEVVLGGSFAKGTWLRGDVDIDVFIRFPKELGKEKLEDVGLKLALDSLKGLKPRLRYSEHPYVEGRVRGVRVNVVPCFKVEKGGWISAADRSPFHTKLIVESFDDTLRNEARLLKRFMKTVGIYGAEVKVQGFSGYVCEVMVLKYRSFLSTLQAASNFREAELISVSEFQEGFKDIFKSPLVILDPVDPMRNLGSAISATNVGLMIQASRIFLERSHTRYFTAQKDFDPVSSLRKSPLIGGLVVVTFHHRERSPDILWGQLRRSSDALCRQLQRRAFQVFRNGSASDEKRRSGLIILVHSQDLPRDEVRQGPKVQMKADSDQFISKNLRKSKLMWIGRDSRIYSIQGRRYVSAKALIEELLSGRLEGSGLAPGLKDEVYKTFKVYAGREALDVARRHAWLAKEVYSLVTSNRLAFGAD